MIQNINKVKINLKENKATTLLTTMLFLSLFWLKEINFLFYDTLESPDIDKYEVYLEHFFNNIVTNKEHGLMYYYLHSLNYSTFILNLIILSCIYINQYNKLIFTYSFWPTWVLQTFKIIRVFNKHNLGNPHIFKFFSSLNFNETCF